MSHIQIIKSIPDTPDIISFDEIRKSIFFRIFAVLLTDLFTDLITRLPKQEQLTAKTPMPTGITKKIFWEYFDIQKFICEKEIYSNVIYIKY